MASPGRLIVLLYDRAVRDLEIAAAAIREENLLLKGQRISHAQEILSELLGALDLRAGGEIAASLSRLYLYMIQRLLEANRSLSVPILEEVATLLREIRAGWEGAARQERPAGPSGPASEAAAAPGGRRA